MNCEIQNKEKHLDCACYCNVKRKQIIYHEDLPVCGFREFECTEENVLVFVMQGQITINVKQHKGLVIDSGNMFFVESGVKFFVRSDCGASLIWCDMKGTLSLCKQFSLRTLISYVRKNRKIFKEYKEQFCTLTMIDLLETELSNTQEIMCRKMMCIHFQHLKINVLMLILRTFYSKRDLSRIFLPVLNEEYVFMQEVLRHYEETMNVNELIDLMGISQSTFNRKFKKAFGVSAGQYILARKKEKMMRDLIMTDISVKELAEKYCLTPNYMAKFIKTNFGKSPTELRNDMSREYE